MSIFPSHFLKKYFVRKNWQGGDESLLKNDRLHLLNMLFPGRIYIARGPWHLGDFCNIFLPNISEDQKKAFLSECGTLALCHMANSALVIALRP